jgi:ligand-binding sensor domain-containing protein/two-component sensor histidine kinase
MKARVPIAEKNLLLILAVQFIFFYAAAQKTISLPFETLTINDGLSQGFVSGILQDKMGFMWFGTNDGLNRYDGYKFLVYHHNPSDSTSLSDNEINCLYEDSKQRLWIGTQNKGIDIFDRQHLTFIHLKHTTENSLRANTIISINEDKTGVFWIATDEGIDRLSITNKNAQNKNEENLQHFFANHQLQFTHIIIPNESEKSKRSISAPRMYIYDNDLLISTDNGIYKILIKNNTSYQLIEKFKSAEDQPYFIKDQLTNEWIMQNSSGVYKFTGDNFTNLKKIYQPAATRNRIMIDKTGRIWIADKDKTVLINRAGEIQNISANNYEVDKLLGGVNSFYTDRNGVIWIGTYGYGMLKLNPEKEHFHLILPQLTAYQLADDNDGKIIANSMLRITVKNGQLIKIDSIKNQKHSEYIVADRNENYWRSADGALLYCNNTLNQNKKINLPATDKNLPPFPLYIDSSNVWMGYEKQFLQYNIHDNSFHVYNYPVVQDKDNFDFLQTICPDVDNILWLGTQNGLMRFNKKNASWKYYAQKNNDTTTLSNNYIFSLCNDPLQPAKYLWIATNGGGLNRLDKSTGKFIRYTVDNGLPNNVVYGILADDNGNLWLSTNKGLSEFNIQNKTFRNFDVSDGLQGNEFDRYSYCKTKDGLLFFGGVNGINFFNPAEIKPLQPPPVLITDFRLFNKTVSLKTPHSPLTKDILYTNSIQLNYDQDVITFQFASTDYRKAGGIYYRYMMKGFDKEWIYGGTFREATYTNLNAGKYNFIVEASNDNMQWSKNAKTISLQIIPPWWRTWWFYILIGIITAVIIYSVYQYRLKQILKLQRVRNRIATDLHDEIGSSLSTISIYSKVAQEQLKSHTSAPDDLLKKISENTNEMMDAMNDIVWTINARNDRFENIINRMREHAVQLFEAKDYTLHFNFDEQLNHLKFDMEKRKDFYLIYKEALNNIAKYAEAKNVWIDLLHKNSSIVLSVKDDGKGFDKNAVRKSANGLINMHSRAANLKGNIEIKSEPQHGTEICLSFPNH